MGLDACDDLIRVSIYEKYKDNKVYFVTLDFLHINQVFWDTVRVVFVVSINRSLVVV